MHTSFQRYLRLCCSLLCLLMMTACGARESLIVTQPVIDLAAAPALMHSMAVGNVEGGASMFVRGYNEPSEGDFKEALERSLASQGVLASSGKPPHYIVDAKIDYHTPTMVTPWEEAVIGLDVTYDISAIATHQSIWHDTIRTTASTPSMNNGSVWKGLLLTSPLDAQARLKKTTDKATKDNFEQFCKKLPTILPTQ